MDLGSWLDAIDEPVFALDGLGRFVAVNEAARLLTGYGLEELLGAPCTRVFPDNLCGCGEHENGSIPRGETVLARKDGAKYNVLVSKSNLEPEPGQHWSLYTVHPEAAARVDVFSPTERQRSILDSLEEGVVTIDENWRVTALNRSAVRILGIPEHSAVGLLCSHVLRSELCQDSCPLTRVLERKNAVRNERVQLTRHDGQPVQVSINCAVLRNSTGEDAGGVLSFRELPEPHQIPGTLEGTGFHGMVGKSGSMRQVFRLIQDVADSPSTVLITGESGTGKELVANAVQAESTRRDGPSSRSTARSSRRECRKASCSAT
ncbi:MAG: PAS domain-containing protein [Candidatus Eisenbacteria bacterium]